MKCRSSKAHVFLSVIKTVFPMFDMITARFAEVRMHFKGCQGHLKFRLASGNAGTGKCQRGAYEHGCEFAPVARLIQLQVEILSAPCRHYSASVLRRTEQLSSQSNGKTVYNQEKHVTKNCRHFISDKIIFLHNRLIIQK